MCGRKTIAAGVGRNGHRTGEPSSSFQSKNNGPLENGSTFHGLATGARSSWCLLQLWRT